MKLPQPKIGRLSTFPPVPSSNRPLRPKTFKALVLFEQVEYGTLTGGYYYHHGRFQTHHLLFSTSFSTSRKTMPQCSSLLLYSHPKAARARPSGIPYRATPSKTKRNETHGVPHHQITHQANYPDDQNRRRQCFHDISDSTKRKSRGITRSLFESKRIKGSDVWYRRVEKMMLGRMKPGFEIAYKWEWAICHVISLCFDGLRVPHSLFGLSQNPLGNHTATVSSHPQNWLKTSKSWRFSFSVMVMRRPNLIDPSQFKKRPKKKRGLLVRYFKP